MADMSEAFGKRTLTVIKKGEQKPQNSESVLQNTPPPKEPPRAQNKVEPKKEQTATIGAKANIGWLFYKYYFNGLDFKNLSANEEKINKKVQNIINCSISAPKTPSLGQNAEFKLKTTYPGLLLGSGYSHELPDVKGQAILGFYFDYTSGLPEILGSSIKGVLRSAFKSESYIRHLLNDENIDVKALEIEIFGQTNGSDDVKAGKDIFFDAIISKPNKNAKILGDDYITPHKEPTKNPIPLRFIKVLPEVEFLFLFKLYDGVITPERKAKLFKDIILDMGLGAKTNVGYGKFI